MVMMVGANGASGVHKAEEGYHGTETGAMSVNSFASAVTLNVWPVGAPGTIEVHSLQALQSFAAIGDTVALPPGYEAAIRFNLASTLVRGQIKQIRDAIQEGRGA